MTEIDAHGLAVEVPTGWEGRIFRRLEADSFTVQAAEVPGPTAPAGERTFPLLQVASIALPIDAADYGSDITPDLGSNDALIILKEFDPADAAQPLFARAGMPTNLGVDDFSPPTLQRSLDGQAGHQTFFHEGGRAFCLYVVLGDETRRADVVPRVNDVLETIRVEVSE
jgi:hypothetical protein